MSKKPLTPDEIAFLDRVAAAAAENEHYAVLGVDPSMTATEVDSAYRELVRTWHPDRFHARDQGAYAAAIQDTFVYLTRAWKVLRDDAARAAYDRELQLTGRMPSPKSVAASTASQLLSQASARGEPSSFEVRVNRAGGAVRLESTAPTVAVQSQRPKAPAAVEKIRQQLAEQFGKAKAYYDAGMAEVAQGNFAQAESTLYLATRYDPRNPAYQQAYKDAAAKAKQSRAAHYLTLAETAESYAKTKEAVDLLRKAVACDPAEGTAYFRLGRLLRDSEDDPRGAVDMYRKAVAKDPKNLTWRLALAELYDVVGLKQNAQREARTILEADPKHEKAKALLKRLGQ